MPESAHQIADVLIVGAGLSGLCAAKRIRDKHPSVGIKVLDRCSAAGGNLSGFKSRWITENHFHAVELCRELGVALERRNGAVGVAGGRRRDVTPFGGLVWGPLASLECTRLMAEIDSLCSGRFIAEYPMNMDEFLEAKLLFETSKEFFRFLIKISCGYNPVELTVTDWLKFCQSMASSMSCLYEMLTMSEDHLVPAGGGEWAGLVEKLVEAIGPDDVILSCEVTHVQYTDEDFVMVHDGSGGHWLARTVICAISCNDLFQIQFVPSRPMILLLNVPDSSEANITHVTEFRAQFRSSEWRDQGYSGNLFLPSRRIICFESTERYGLVGSFFHVENLSVIDARQTILGILASTLNSPTLMDPLSFNSNCNPIPFFVEAPFNFHRRIILSSSNASCWYRGFINGSVQAGIKAAILALLEVRPQTINLKDVTDMQCVLFKYFRPQSPLERLWAMVNLASVRQLVAIVSTIVATFRMVRGMVRSLFEWKLQVE
ncbi:amine oxidase [flavin-containing] A [Culex pipiens pallens]|uniref:amine oxidase [flavin-containing] A n=1 Tax=Culex pipiens pallens TaxID=42434 RepID=UPI0019535246|nr:amine oxidase [flavin-containing] A [Culex pipiens pallens]